jgi:transcriptional regulator with XRE-family HTH domain
MLSPGINIKVRGGTYLNVGKRIQDRRKELNISVDELAARLNKNRTTVYRYEKGDIENLPLSTLKPLAEILETTPAYLMGWVDGFSGHTEAAEEGDDKERDMHSEDCRIRDSKEDQLSAEFIGETSGCCSINSTSIIDCFKNWMANRNSIEFTDEEYEKIVNYIEFLMYKRNK